jgi:hypothetical protein
VLNGEFEQIQTVGAEIIPEMHEIAPPAWTAVLDTVGSQSAGG